MRRGAALALVLLVCCRPRGASLEQTYSSLQRSLANGEYKAVLAQTGSLLTQYPADSLWHWKFRILDAKAAHYVEPKRLFERLAQEPPSAAGFGEIAIERKIWLGNAHVRAGHLEEADHLLEQALKEAEAGGFEDLALDALIGSCGRLLMNKQYEQAVQLLRSTGRRARKRGNARTLAHALNGEAFALIKTARHAEAIPALEEAAGLAQTNKAAAYFAILNNLGISYARMGEFSKALEIQQRAIAGQQSLGYTQGLVEALGEIGTTYQQQGLPREALPSMRRALELARERGMTEDAARLAGNLATLHIDFNEWDEAARLNREAIALKKKSGATTLVYNTLNDAAIALGTGEGSAAGRLYTEALADRGSDATVRWQAHVGLARLSSAGGDVAAAKSHYEAAIGLVEASRAELASADLRISYFNRLIDFYRRYVDFLLERGDAAEALSVAESSRAKVLAERAGYPAGQRLPPAAYQRLARMSKSIILSYWLGPGRACVWIVTGAGIEAVPLDVSDIGSLVETYSRVILSQSPMAAEAESGRRLTKMLLEPVLGRIPREARVIVAPDGALHNLNFETLPVNGGYFIEHSEVTIAPSLALLASAGQQAPHSHPRLLLVGDPESVDPRYPRLENARQEMTAVAQPFPEGASDTLRGAQATPEAFLQSHPEQASRIHFTAHSIANRERPLDSAVVLSPGPSGRYMLYARDLIKLRLGAELVTVSSCRSAGGRSYSGEGLVGFAWAFLRAGAARVVAGLWDVDDSATAELMGSLYSGMQAGLSPAAALRVAKLAFLKKGANFGKPYFWGPFQLYAARV